MTPAEALRSQQPIQLHRAAECSTEIAGFPAREAANFSDGQAVDCALHGDPRGHVLERDLRHPMKVPLGHGKIQVRKANLSELRSA